MELKHKSPQQDERERKNPIHAALHMVLVHLGISQPEIKKEAATLDAKLDDMFEGEPIQPTAEETTELIIANEKEMAELRARTAKVEAQNADLLSAVNENANSYKDLERTVDQRLTELKKAVSDMEAIATKLIEEMQTDPNPKKKG